jgi:hypothetical protein
MKTILIFEKTGGFAENKDIARSIRMKFIDPSVTKSEEITLDFKDIDSMTQSFLHALISETIRERGPNVLDLIYFKNCNENVQNIVNIVVEYMQI